MHSTYIDIHTHSQSCDSTTLSAWGVHPWRAEEVILPIEKSNYEGVEVVGEIGLDFCCTVPKIVQQRVFEAQLQIAQDLGKIVVIHCVRAYNEVLATLKKYSLRVVIFHGFIGSAELMHIIIQRGYYISYGERTLSSPKTVEALRATPLNKIFVETDTSILSINEIHKHIATLRGIDEETLRDEIYKNYTYILGT